MEHKPAEIFHPGEYVREEIDARGWSQTDFAAIIGRPIPFVNQLLHGKIGITPETAIQIGEAFDMDPMTWMNLDAHYRRWSADADIEGIRERAKLFDIGPVKEMQKRQWIATCKQTSDLDKTLKEFYETLNLEDIAPIALAARSSAPDLSAAAPAMRAWCHMAIKMARAIPAGPYSEGSVKNCIQDLKQLVSFADQIRLVPRIMAKHGIRLVVIEHLAGTKLDGAALWNDKGQPVIALSMRFDRIDYFWHTLLHEISHIAHRDKYALDTDILSPDGLSDVEERANKEAAECLIDSKELRSFIIRKAPLFSKKEIIQFANKIAVHPGIVAGQLQFKGEVKWAAYREMLVKVRDILTSEAPTDGWGHHFSL